jgi:tetratricopeptide (TPR) repeat protein
LLQANKIDRIYSSRIEGGPLATVGVKSELAVDAKRSFLWKDSPARTVLFGLILGAVTLALYSPTHNHPYVNLDDAKYVTQNPHISDGLTLGSVFWAFTHGYAGNWHPLTWVSHAVDIQIFGFDPAPQHDENSILHAINALLLFLVLKRATGYTGRSFMVAALFALHPVNVESVAWIAERKTMLSTLFCFLALGAYRWYASRPAVARYIVVTGLFVLGLMSKPQIIMLPLALLLWDYWPLQRMSFGDEPATETGSEIPVRSFWWLVKEKLPLFFICLVDAGVTVIAQHVAAQKQDYPLGVRIANALVSYVRYIGKAFWPTKLALYYPHPGNTLQWWQVGGALLLLLTITALALKAHRHRYYIVGWLWFLIMLVPCIGLIQADVQGMADRYAYVSFIGLFLMVCWGLSEWAAERRWPKALLPAAGTAALVALSLTSWRQVGYWRDDVTLWSHSAQVTTGNWKAEYLWGGGLDGLGRPSEALAHYRRAVAIEPNDPFVNMSIAAHEQLNGDFASALGRYKNVLAHAWNGEQSAAALNGMAMCYRAMGDYTSADACLAKTKVLPKRAIDWQGAWWEHIIPAIKQYFKSGSTS